MTPVMRSGEEVCYFFGVRPGDSSGHFCHTAPNYYRPRDWPAPTPWGEGDQWYGPISETKAMEACWVKSRDGQPEGVPRFARSDGWTMMTLWDRSADSRGGCCAIFAANRDLSPGEAFALFRVRFPEVFDRIEGHLGRSIAPRDELAELVVQFRTSLADIQSRYGRSHVRAHPQGDLLDALEQGEVSDEHARHLSGPVEGKPGPLDTAHMGERLEQVRRQQDPSEPAPGHAVAPPKRFP